MNALGVMFLAGSARCLALSAIGAVLCLAIRRRGPAEGASAALATLTGLAVLAVLALSPWPRWWDVGAPRITGAEATLAQGATTPHVDSQGVNTSADIPTAIHRPAPATAESETWAVAFAQAFDSAIRRPADVKGERWGWTAWIAAAYLACTAAALGRLGLGLWGVGRLRRRARQIEDAGLIERIEAIRAEMGIIQAIQTYESEEVGTAATVGWRWPALLLPEDWRGWGEAERGAVLAHELAHVRRGDYAAGVWAQACLALNVYQPLAYWLSGRLRLQQELAADAWGARLSGGNRPYLQTLARLALGRDRRASAWPSRAFLPIRGTLTRRIEMLRDAKPVDVLTPRRQGRAVTIAALAVAGLALAGVRGPAGPNAARAQDAPASKPKAAGGSFDFRLVPTDAGMIVAARPAELLGKPEFQALNGLIGPDGQMTKQLGIRPDRVEQVALIWFRPLDPDRRPHSPLPPPSAAIVRTTEAHDWSAFTGRFLVTKQPEEVTYAGRSYTRAAVTVNGPAYFRPDDRTIVLSPCESDLKRYLSGRLLPDPRHAWDEAWAAAGKGQVGLAVDSAFLVETLAPALAQPQAAAKLDMFSPLWTKANAHALILNGSKAISLDYAATCNSDEGAGQAAKTIEALLTLAGNALPGLRRQAADAPKAMAELIGTAQEAVGSAKVEREGRIVRVRASAKSELAALVKNAMLPAVGSARAAARRSQGMNNMKQLALAMHIYASAHNDKLPPPVVMGPDGKTPHSWRVELLPYLEQAELYNQYKMNEPWDSPANRKVLEARPALFAYPDAEMGATDSAYFVVTGPETMFPEEGSDFSKVSDGLSNTIMIVEAKRPIPWTKPEDVPLEAGKPVPRLGGFQTEPAGFSAVFGDGSVKFIAGTIDAELLRKLFTRAGGEPVKLP